MNILIKRINIFLAVLFAVVVLPLWVGLLRGKEPSLPVLGKISQSISNERRQVSERSKIAILNLLMPPEYRSLAEIVNSRKDPKSVDLDAYIQYYRQASQVLPAPWSADAYAMLGFCYYQQGKAKESLENYLRSLEQNSAFIWTYYNLAMIAFGSQDYGKVIFLTEAVLKADPKVSLTILTSSKIYTDILRDSANAFDLEREMKNVYSEAARMLVISLYKTGNFSQAALAAQSALDAGFEPAAVFAHYAGMAHQELGDDVKAGRLLKSAGTVPPELLTGTDLSVRFF